MTGLATAAATLIVTTLPFAVAMIVGSARASSHAQDRGRG